MKKSTIYIYIVLVVLAIEYANSELIIEGPANLKNQFYKQNYSLNISIGNFGNVPYGKQIKGAVNISSTLYSCNVNNTDTDSDADKQLLDEPKKNKKKQLPLIILAKRGGCSFIQKAYNAQQEGAKLLIIIDNKEEQLENIIMIEDGHGDEIRIPTILIARSQGEKLLQYIQDLQDQSEDSNIVTVTVKFPTFASEAANVNFWLNMDNRESFKILREFSTFYSGFPKETLDFNVHYLNYECRYCSNLQSTPPNCIAKGKYCLEDPDGYGLQNFGTGRDTLYETIRQKCIFQLDVQQWFEYMQAFDNECIKPSEYSHCSKDLIQKLNKIDQNDVDECFKKQTNSNAEDDSLIPMLQDDQDAIQESKLFLWPSITVNNQTYRGKLDGLDVLEYICSNILEQPPICREANKAFGEYSDENRGANITLIVTIVVIVLILFFVFMIFVYKKMVKKELYRDMPTQVNEMVSQYLEFYETRQSRLDDK